MRPTALSTLNSPLPGASFEHTREVTLRGNVVPFKADRQMAAVGLAFGSEATLVCNHFPGAAAAYQADATSSAQETDTSLSSSPPDCLSP